MADPTPPVMATGYFYHQPSIDRVKSDVALACAAGPGISGAAKAAIASGIHYHNLTAYLADFIKREGSGFIKSQRNLIDCGNDGVVLEPLAQATGICDGCSYGEAEPISWAARYVMTGIGPRPRECSFLWPYLGGRDLTIVPRGDSGAIPPLSAELYMTIGAMPVDCSGSWNLQSLKPHGPGSQEALCVQLRDNPLLAREMCDRVAPYKLNVYSPNDEWDAADCLQTGRAVTSGCSYQIRETSPGSNGISPLYHLGGHETCLSGWFTFQNRLGFIKTESWWSANGFPGSQWPNRRVTIQTDDGPKMLYPGQGSLWADEWLRCSPELWALDAPGTA